MTINEFNDYVQKFKQQDLPSYNGMKRGECFYRPMLQVVDYLTRNYFRVYVVSGTDRFIVRGIIHDSMLNLPNSQIIGSDETVVASGQAAPTVLSTSTVKRISLNSAVPSLLKI